MERLLNVLKQLISGYSSKCNIFLPDRLKYKYMTCARELKPWIPFVRLDLSPIRCPRRNLWIIKNFQNRVDRGTQMFDSGNLQAALEIFTGLFSSDISDLDKSSMCLNIAVVYDKLGTNNSVLNGMPRQYSLKNRIADLKRRNTLQRIETDRRPEGKPEDLGQLAFLLTFDGEPIKFASGRTSMHSKSRSTSQCTAALEHKQKIHPDIEYTFLHEWIICNPADEPRNTSMPSVLESLNSALHRAFSDNLNVYLLGEDILDPYGGAFKVSRGLSTSFPERVLTTPISEAGFVGVAAGMALRGLRPVVEIMFGDFVTLIADQMINHIAKFRWMYNNQVRLPIVIRTPMGGRRGYGPTHSQTLGKTISGCTWTTGSCPRCL